MISATYRLGDDTATKTITRLEQALHPSQLDRVVDRVALETHKSVVEKTPKRFFGQVRKAWQIAAPAEGVRSVFNPHKAMRFLEEGTVAHGPVTKRALFIPMTARAAIAYANATGFEGANLKRGNNPNWQGETVKGLRVFTPKINRGGNKVNMARELVYGQDYVLAKWVRGIRPRFIVAGERVLTEIRLHNAVKDHVRTALHG